MWNDAECWIVPSAPTQLQIVTPSASIQLACLGYGETHAHDLTDGEIQEIERVADDLHRRTSWAVPCDPLALADLAGVALTAYPVGSSLPEGWGPDRSTYLLTGHAADDALAAAFALASALGKRGVIAWTTVARWRLATELLVPAWALDQQADAKRTSGVRVVASTAPRAPWWLIEQRQTQRADADAAKNNHVAY